MSFILITSIPHFFFLKDTPPTEIYPLPLPDALPIYDLLAGEVPEQQVVRTAAAAEAVPLIAWPGEATPPGAAVLAGLVEGLNNERVLREALLKRRSEEHTSELQSQSNLVCRLLLEKQ